MRPKVIFGVLALALGLLGVMVLVSRLIRPAPVVAATTRERTQFTNEVPVTRLAVSSATPTEAAAVQDFPGRAKTGFVQERVAELIRLSETETPEAHAVFLSELTNYEKDIRQAALEAVIQIHDPKDVPRLEAVLETTTDPEERAALREGIDILNLPSFTDTIAEQGGGPSGQAAARPSANAARQRLKARRNRAVQ